MTVKEAKEKLEILRKCQNKLCKQIDVLRLFVFIREENQMLRQLDLSRRNRSIYCLHLKGYSYCQIAARYNLSGARIGGICRRINAMILKKRDGFEYYTLKM